MADSKNEGNSSKGAKNLNNVRNEEIQAKVDEHLKNAEVALERFEENGMKLRTAHVEHQRNIRNYEKTKKDMRLFGQDVQKKATILESEGKILQEYAKKMNDFAGKNDESDDE